MTISDALSKINAYLPHLKERCEGLLVGRSAQKAQRMIDTINKYETVKSISELKTDEMKECLSETIGSSKDSFYESDIYISAMEAYQQTFVSKDFLP